MDEVMLITGTRTGIGRYLVDYYVNKHYRVIGCSRQPLADPAPKYRHFCLDVGDERAVRRMVHDIARSFGRIDVLINNAGIASMNHSILTPLSTVQSIFATNVFGTFLLMREAAKIMMRRRYGRIVNFATVATPLRLEGEAAYAASKAAVESYTQVLAKELSPYNITVNAVGPTPIKTDLIKNVPAVKLQAVIDAQAIKRFGEPRDVSNVIDFFISPESDFVSGQTVYLGGVTG